MNLKIHQVDIVTAYLNGELSQDVFMEIPDYLMEVLQKLKNGSSLGSSKAKSNKARGIALEWLQKIQMCKKPVCKLRKALYGLKQSGLEWYQKLTTKLNEASLVASERDPCLFTARRAGKILILAAYVDDLLLASDDDDWVDEVKSFLVECFEMRDMSQVQSCLGVQFKQDLGKHQVFLSQSNYTNELLRRFSMQNCKPAQTTPMKANLKLEKPVVSEENVSGYPYQSLIGTLMYLSLMT